VVAIIDTKTLLDFVTTHCADLYVALDNERLYSAELLQQIGRQDEEYKQAEELLRKVRGQISPFYELKREMDTLKSGSWSLTGITIEHNGEANIDAIERLVKRMIIALNTLSETA